MQRSRCSGPQTQNNSLMKWCLLLLCSISCFFSKAQETTKAGESFPGKTCFFAEVGGPGVLFSANVDTRFKKTNLGWGGRAGIGFVTEYEQFYDPTFGYTGDRRRSVLTVPVQVNYIFGKSNSPHTFEAGAGITAMSKKIDPFNSFYEDSPTYLFGTFSFMYRRQPVNGGFTWRLGFTPLVSGGYVQPSGGGSVGWSF